jgi:hypothetical protein
VFPRDGGRIIVFVDEGGLSERPHRKTQPGAQGANAPRCNITSPGRRFPPWPALPSGLYFRLFAGAMRSPQVIEFLRHLLGHLGGKLLIVWSGLWCIAAGR